MNSTEDDKVKATEVTLFEEEREVTPPHEAPRETPAKQENPPTHQRTKTNTLQDLRKPPTDSAAWNAIMQKRLLELNQANANNSNNPSPADQHVSSKEELAETLKKLETDVARLQKNDRYKVPAPHKQDSPGDFKDDFYDDISPRG